MTQPLKNLFFLFIFLGALFVGGCASTHQISTEAEFRAKVVLAEYTVRIDGPPVDPKDIPEIWSRALRASLRAHLMHSLAPEDVAAVGRLLDMSRALLEYPELGPTLKLALVDSSKSWAAGDTIYLSIRTGLWELLETLVHEDTHLHDQRVRPEPGFWALLVMPGYWFRTYPSSEFAEELRADAAMARLFSLCVAACSTWRPPESERLFPLMEGDVSKLLGFNRSVRTHADLRTFCLATAKSAGHADYAQVAFCQALLEADLGSPEAVWTFVQDCDDEVLEAKINEILGRLSAEDAIKKFVEGRTKLFQ